MNTYGAQWGGKERREDINGTMGVNSFVCSHGLGTCVVVVLPYAKIVRTVGA